jgi:hypothetical protein
VFAHFGPVTLAWTNTASGDWNTASNWTPNLAPGSNDTVYLTTGNSTITLNTNADLADFVLGHGSSPPTLTGSGTLTIRGRFSWNWGNLSGTGRTIVETAGTLAIVSANSVSLATRTLENGGATVWTGSSGRARLQRRAGSSRPDRSARYSGCSVFRIAVNW